MEKPDKYVDIQRYMVSIANNPPSKLTLQGGQRRERVIAASARPSGAHSVGETIKILRVNASKGKQGAMRVQRRVPSSACVGPGWGDREGTVLTDEPGPSVCAPPPSALPPGAPQ